MSAQSHTFRPRGNTTDSFRTEGYRPTKAGSVNLLGFMSLEQQRRVNSKCGKQQFSKRPSPVRRPVPIVIPSDSQTPAQKLAASVWKNATNVKKNIPFGETPVEPEMAEEKVSPSNTATVQSDLDPHAVDFEISRQLRGQQQSAFAEQQDQLESLQFSVDQLQEDNLQLERELINEQHSYIDLQRQFDAEQQSWQERMISYQSQLWAMNQYIANLQQMTCDALQADKVPIANISPDGALVIHAMHPTEV